MKNFIIIFIFFLMLPLKSFAGPFTDSLSKCIVISTNEREQAKLVNWVFRVVSEHPVIKSEIGNVFTDSQKTKSDVHVAEIFTELLTKRCKKEAYEAIKYEGNYALENAFESLGEVAMAKMMEDRKVLESIQQFTKYVDYNKFEEIFGELYSE